MGYEKPMRTGLGSTFGHDAGGSDLTAWGWEIETAFTYTIGLLSCGKSGADCV